nr:hypothetical protein [Candidatus Rhabdochlamydia oedothoracis]
MLIGYARDLLTTDNGKEFAYHQMVSFELETDFLLCNALPFLGKRLK